MKITWTFADGTISEVEVEEDLGEFITASRREESNLERKERYHCYSLDSILFEGEDYGDWHTPEATVVAAEYQARIDTAFSQLTEIQQRRLAMLSDGLSIRKIAALEGKDYRSVYESIESAKKAFLKYFRKTPHQSSPLFSVYRGAQKTDSSERKKRNDA